MQFINFPPAKIGTKVQENNANTKKPAKSGTAMESTGRTNTSEAQETGTIAKQGGTEGDTPSGVRPLLGRDGEEAERLTYAGRSWPALKESKTFDSERLATSPLFERSLFT